MSSNSVTARAALDDVPPTEPSISVAGVPAARPEQPSPDSAAAATSDSVLRGLREIADELEQNLRNIPDADFAGLSEPLQRLHRIVAARLSTTAAAPPDLGGSAPAGALAAGARSVSSSRVPVGRSLAAIGCWFVLFALGASVPSSPYMDVLENMHNDLPSAVPAGVGCMLIVVATSTFINPGILACLAAYLGGISRRLQTAVTDGAALPVAENGTAAVMRGFFLYVAGVAGLLLITTQSIKSLATQDQYVQLAGMLSALAFVVGYDPGFFLKLMNRVDGWAKDRSGGRTGGSDGPSTR